MCHSFHQKHPIAVITKFNFCGLFKEAWLHAISPENVTGGFRKAGVHLYDPMQISALKKAGESSGAKAGDDMSTASSSGSGGVASGDGAGSYEDNDSPGDSSDDSDNESPFDGVLHGDGHTRASGLPGDDNSCHPGSNGHNGGVSAKKEVYQRRCEEGYDLFDPDYVLWLVEHHPEAVPADSI